MKVPVRYVSIRYLRSLWGCTASWNSIILSTVDWRLGMALLTVPEKSRRTVLIAFSLSSSHRSRNFRWRKMVCSRSQRISSSFWTAALYRSSDCFASLASFWPGVSLGCWLLSTFQLERYSLTAPTTGESEPSEAGMEKVLETAFFSGTPAMIKATERHW